jgi:hypothetical protein
VRTGGASLPWGLRGPARPGPRRPRLNPRGPRPGGLQQRVYRRRRRARRRGPGRGIQPPARLGSARLESARLGSPREGRRGTWVGACSGSARGQKDARGVMCGTASGGWGWGGGRRGVWWGRRGGYGAGGRISSCPRAHVPRPLACTHLNTPPNQGLPSPPRRCTTACIAKSERPRRRRRGARASARRARGRPPGRPRRTARSGLAEHHARRRAASSPRFARAGPFAMRQTCGRRPGNKARRGATRRGA